MRQRQVFPAEMVCHLWANRAQDSARTQQGNLYFTGPTLYSYGSHFAIGHFLECGRLLWNDSTYSMTTTRQQSDARHALTRPQWESAVHVPALSGNDCRGKESVMLPGIADACVSAAMSAIEAAEKGRAGTRAWCGNVYTARKYLQSARELYTLAGRAKAAAAVPTLPDSPEETKPAYAAFRETLRAILRQAKCAEYLARAESLTQRAGEHLTQATASAAGAENGSASSRDSEWNPWGTSAQAVMHHANTCRSLLQDAAASYKLAGRQSTRVRNMLRQCSELAGRFAEQARQDKAAGLSDQVRIIAAEVSRMYGAWRRLQRNGIDPLAYGPHYARSAARTLPHYLGQMRDALNELNAVQAPEQDSPAVRDARKLAGRAMRTHDVYRLRDSMACTRQELQDARRDGTEPPDGRNLLRLADRTVIPEFWHSQALALYDECQRDSFQWRALSAERQAAAIAAWKDGAADVRPAHDWPTLARIRGAYVETSRGASVPLAHACRLARIARRVIAAGGREWPAGDGPMVGHFRVTAIRSDGSAVIGCHTFESDESARVLALLADACACVPDESADSETVHYV